MKIMEILVKESVILDLGVRTKREVLAEMSASLAKVEPQIEAGRLLDVLMEREALQSTGSARRAIPHGKLRDCAARRELRAQRAGSISIDRRPADPPLLPAVVPEHSGGQYLKALADLAVLPRDPASRRASLEASAQGRDPRDRGRRRQASDRRLGETRGSASSGESGALLAGPSGAGKSECALELIARGIGSCRDDAVELSREGSRVIGRAARRSVPTWRSAGSGSSA
jgi:mannitol/fructose-specific phosphotransferase system IIA component (Ntr-type)